MVLIARKYGGSLVVDTELIKRVTKHAVETEKKGNKMAVVISTMGDTIDDLINQALSINSNPPEREMNMLTTAGERISMSLLAMATHAGGSRVHFFTSQQAGFFTGIRYGVVHIKTARPSRVKNALSLGDIVIVAGSQGISAKGDAATFGRSGSDTPAVALAVALGVNICEIYADVDGIFIANPRIVPSARRIPSIDYESTLEMTPCSSKVLTPRCIGYAQRLNMPLHARFSFSCRPGALVMSDGIDPRTLPNLD